MGDEPNGHEPRPAVVDDAASGGSEADNAQTPPQGASITPEPIASAPATPAPDDAMPDNAATDDAAFPDDATPEDDVEPDGDAASHHDATLEPSLRAGEAFTRIAHACLRQLQANAPAAMERDPAALHRMRIALRR